MLEEQFLYAGRTNFRYRREEVFLNDSSVPGTKLSSEIQSTDLCTSSLITLWVPEEFTNDTYKWSTQFPGYRSIHITVIPTSMTDRTSPRQLSIWGKDVLHHCNILLVLLAGEDCFTKPSHFGSERGSSFHLWASRPYPEPSILFCEGCLLMWSCVSGILAIHQEDWKHCQIRKLSKGSISSEFNWL